MSKSTLRARLTQKCGTCRRAKPLNAAEFTQTRSGYAKTCRTVLGGSLMCMQLLRGKQPDPTQRISAGADPGAMVLPICRKRQGFLTFCYTVRPLADSRVSF